MSKSSSASTWRSSLGWTAVALGVVAVVGGGVATHYADKEYNDTPTFERLQNYEYTVSYTHLTLPTRTLV